jgi:phosphocarrier protein HPr
LAKKTSQIQIINKKGLHARASAKFVKLTETFDASIKVSKDGVSVCGSSIMGLMLLAASYGEFITISVEGKDSNKALKAINTLINNKFDEGI